ncbi:MAG: hypothetical protein KDN22_10070 [Verrucomicrobiae bacterium]|nr:hypothetical protein [Verrucomicrobiae bacterium]
MRLLFEIISVLLEVLLYAICVVVAGFFINLLITPIACGQQVVERTLSSEEPATVKVSDRHTTTILFPQPVNAIIGNDLTDGNDGNETAAFQINHPPNSRIVAVIARSPESEAPVVVAIENELFLVNLSYSQDPNLAVTFTAPKAVAAKDAPGGLVRRAILLPPLDFSPPNLLRLLELANAHRLPTSGIAARSVYFPSTRGNVTSTVERVTRFVEDDAIVVSGSIRNHSRWKRASIVPKHFVVQVGARRYPVSMAQAPGSIPRNGRVRFTAILMGDGAKRADFSIDNDFRLIVTPSS